MFYRTKSTGQFWIKAAIMYLPISKLAEQSFSPLRKTSGSEALLDVFFFFKTAGTPGALKYVMSLVGVVTVCLLLGLVSNVMGADANQPKETPKQQPKDNSKLVIGVVTMVKDNDGNITEIKVIAHKELVYQVVLDEKGKELGKIMVDRRARIEGLVEMKGNVHWLTVKTFGEVKARTDGKPTPKKPAGKPAPKPAPTPKY
jgi:hypothetical protein